jgi:hypothetical protein
VDIETGSYSAIPNQNVFNPVALDFDVTQKKIYYSDVRLHQLRRTDIDGNGMVIIKQLAGGMNVLIWDCGITPGFDVHSVYFSIISSTGKKGRPNL